MQLKYQFIYISCAYQKGIEKLSLLRTLYEYLNSIHSNEIYLQIKFSAIPLLVSKCPRGIRSPAKF